MASSRPRTPSDNQTCLRWGNDTDAIRRRRVRHVRRWGAIYVLLVLFLGSWLGQFFTQLTEFRNDQSAHGQEFAWADFWPAFLSRTLENWQSEWLQLIFQALLLLGAKHLLFKADAEDEERVERKIDSIREELRRIAPPP
jgi:hypothetical protein